MCRSCSTHGQEGNADRVFVGKPGGKRSLGRPRHSWEDNINMDVGEIAWGIWTGLMWVRL
jgi:hypothetical protein